MSLFISLIVDILEKKSLIGSLSLALQLMDIKRIYDIFLISGYISLYYWAEFKRIFNIIHFYFHVKKDKKKEIMILRDKISNDIKKIVLSYSDTSQ
jgi:hypothetical protein